MTDRLAERDGITGRLRITETLDLDPVSKRWHCNRCGRDLGPADRNYKEGCLFHAREPSEIHQTFAGNPEYSFTPDPEWCAVVETYCPGCAVLMETEYLPPGHPPTHDIEIDISSVVDRWAS